MDIYIGQTYLLAYLNQLGDWTCTQKEVLNEGHIDGKYNQTQNLKTGSSKSSLAPPWGDYSLLVAVQRLKMWCKLCGVKILVVDLVGELYFRNGRTGLLVAKDFNPSCALLFKAHSFSYCAKLLQSELAAHLLSYELCKVNSLGFKSFTAIPSDLDVVAEKKVAVVSNVIFPLLMMWSSPIHIPLITLVMPNKSGLVLDIGMALLTTALQDVLDKLVEAPTSVDVLSKFQNVIKKKDKKPNAGVGRKNQCQTLKSCKVANRVNITSWDLIPLKGAKVAGFTAQQSKSSQNIF
ncbi:hypothetical protein EDD85DRAFT_791113 [Armillaria nabsnona]|nr:hypothetical protein EDD85DRAFT_791113 [Armillaria nabsnona]